MNKPHPLTWVYLTGVTLVVITMIATGYSNGKRPSVNYFPDDAVTLSRF